MAYSMDIDAVYLWVDGNDPAHRALRRQYATTDKASKHYDGENRWHNNGELRYSLRSLAMFAPWIRRVHIVTNGQVPPWLNIDNPKVRLVTHQQIYRWPEHLPTFNSRSIETHLHRIPDLAEHFLSFNDDMFLGAPCQPTTFFTVDGIIQVALRHQHFPTKGDCRSVRNAAKLLRSLTPNVRYRKPEHQVKAYTLTLLRRAEEQWPDVAKRNSSYRFRANRGVSMCRLVLGNYAIAIGLGIPATLATMRFGLNCNASSNRRKLGRLLHQRPMLFCINDSCQSRNVGPELKRGLSLYFPDTCEYEQA